ncbi:MAG TPA: aldehyde dehydrogenase family protein [Gaiellaceae bacterium]|nr:aldehyde dehydrogenase family protein [Gaiellaceae bacterium]
MRTESTAERLRDTGAEPARAEDAATSELGELGALVGGRTALTGDAVEVRSPYDGRLVAVVHRAGPEEIEEAITRAVQAFEETRRLPSWRRAEILERIAALVAGRRDELARAIALEAGKPVKTARVEVDRASFTFRIAAEESKRIGGEIVPLDWAPGMEGRIAHVRRVPLGPVAGITPFNFPLNLVVHKVAPALAAGDPIVIRPASQTPASALLLGEMALEAGWPAGGIAVVPSSTETAAPLVEDDRIRMLTFTGSPAVGWALKARAGRKRVTLELGGNAGVIVNADADVPFAAERVAWGGFVYAGQTCISVQRVLVHDDVHDRFLAEFLPRVEALRAGDPLEEETDVGPLIDDGASARVAEWVEEALAGGAEALAGGRGEGRLWQPTVLAGAAETMRVSCREAFAPLVVVSRFEDVGDAIAGVDRSDYGLQAGIFTRDWPTIRRAFEEIEVGGLVVNDVPTFRIDHMPYGGVKQSGLGREGVRYAIEEMTELRLLALNERD